MKRRLAIIWIMVLAMVSMGMSALAMHVEFKEDMLSATGLPVDGGAEEALQAREFELLGTDEDGAYLIFVNNRFMKLDAEALAPVLETIGAETAAALPSITSYETLQRRMSGDEVQALQQKLIDLEIMDGGADGSFGRQSERAVSQFQEAMGLEATGVADPMLQMLMDSVKAEPVIVDAVAASDSPKDPFAVISGKTEANLDAAADLGLTLDYDDMAGSGMISKGSPLAYTAPSKSDLDRRSFELRFGLRAEQGEGEVTVTPVLEIVSTGVQRPIMEEVVIKSGDERHTFPVEGMDDGVSGLMALESARVALDAETVELLANAADNGELKVRVTCRYGEYDIEFTGEALKNAAEIGQAALRLND